MKVLGVDFGLVRTGIAISDCNQVLASPLCVIKEKDSEVLAQKIGKICTDEGVRRVVVGLPKNMDGSEGASAQNARTFADMLRKITNLPVFMIDERGTTITATNFLNDTNVRGKKRKNVVDAVAATVILQNYLDSL